MSDFSIVAPPSSEPISQTEAAAYLKLEQSEDAPLVASLIGSAREACETYTGQALIQRDVKLKAVQQGLHFYLKGRPLVTLLSASWQSGTDEIGLDATSLETGEHLGRSFVELPTVTVGARVTVEYRIGLGADWNGVPEALRLGMLRLIAHQYETRSSPGIDPLPGAVTALWQPYKEVRI
ncbi:MAG: hypothetical protein AAF337_00065 [Pseudomonadota bacterium]